MRSARGLALAIALLATAGCADSSDLAEVAAQRQGIIDGQASEANDDAVVMIRTVPESGPEVVCSASLVAPNLLITARHCVSYLTVGLFTCSVEGELMNGGDGAGELGLHFPPGLVEVHGRQTPRDEPVAYGQRIISTLSVSICNNDLAFVVLDRALELPIVPLRLGRPAELGELGVMVGFGMKEGQDLLDYREQPRQRRTGLSIAGVGPDSLEDGVTTVAPRSLILDGPSGCTGDSGGPLLADATGALLGVYSLHFGASCEAPSSRQHLVHVPPFERLIADAFEAAAAEPVLEATATAGAGGQASSDGGEPAAEGGAGSSAPGGSGGAPSEAPVDESEPDDSGCGVAANGARRADRQQAWPALLALALALAAQRRGPRRRARPACWARLSAV